MLAANGSVLTNKYSEGYPGKRYYGGNRVIDEVEDVAIDRVKALFGADAANVQPHSGANANLAAYLALLQPGDTVMGLRLDQGGHLTHGSPVNASGRLFRFVSYGLTPSDERIDLDQVRDLARTERPKLIVTGATAYPRIIDPIPFREIADEVGALFLFDAAHIAGLIAGGVHPNPVPHSDVVTFTTHKTLRGPRGGCIVSTSDYATPIDKAVFPGLQGGPLEHVIAAKAVAFHEAADPSFREYAQQIVRNAQALAAALAAEGFRLVSGGTDNHLLLVDLRTFDAELTGKIAQEVLDRAGITLNKNTIPDDPRSPFVTSGVRIGTPAVTTQGMREPEMARIAELIARSLRHRDDEAEQASVRRRGRRALLEVRAVPRAQRPRPLARLGVGWPFDARPGRLPHHRWCRRHRHVRAHAARALLRHQVRRCRRARRAQGARRAHRDTRWRRDVRGVPARDVGGVAPRRVPSGVHVVVGTSRCRARRGDHLHASGCSTTSTSGPHPQRSSGMVLAGGVMSLLGITMFYFRIPFFGLVLLSPDLAPLVTVLWVVGMANAVNLIDGLDGLAAGTVAIAAGAFFLYAQRLNDAGLLAAGSISPMVSVIVLGMCVGLPSAQLPSRAHLHGGLRGAPPRAADGRVDDRRRWASERAVQRPDLLLLRPPVHPALHPRGADPRHDVRDHSPRHRVELRWRPPTRTTCITG